MKYFKSLLSIIAAFVALEFVYTVFRFLVMLFANMSFGWMIFLMFFFGSAMWGLMLLLSGWTMVFVSKYIKNIEAFAGTVYILSIVECLLSILRIWTSFDEFNWKVILVCCLLTLLIFELTFAIVFGVQIALEERE